MRVVICGGGIIGASTAFHLAERQVSAVLIERCSPACAASGKAGGFLAKHWCDHYEVGPLAQCSFDMHMNLSQDPRFQDCDYRRLDTLSVTIEEGQKKKLKNGDIPDWLDGAVVNSSVIGSTSDTAQVHPYKLTLAFLKNAACEVRNAIVEDVIINNGCVTGVKTNEGIIEADKVVIAMGPWSDQLCSKLNLCRVEAQRAHSVIFKANVTPHAIFVNYRKQRSRDRSPEVYPRLDGTVYISGEGDATPLPEDPGDIQQQSCEDIQQMAAEISSDFTDVLQTQACYLPSVSTGLPMIGKVPNIDGLYVATGHSCWGILNAPATGKALAELMLHGKCSFLDLKPFQPKFSQ